MYNNFSCELCGRGVHRSKSQQKQSASGLFFCTKWCKSSYAPIKREPLKAQGMLFASDTKIYKTISRIWDVKRDCFLLTIIKVHSKYVDELGDYVVNAKLFVRNDNSTVCSAKNPNDVECIRSNFSAVKLSDIESIVPPNVKWNSIEFRQYQDVFIFDVK